MNLPHVASLGSAVPSQRERKQPQRAPRPVVVSVFGTRPQLIKLAAIWELLDKCFHSILIDSGQHYDFNLADVFYEDQGIRRPDLHLGVSRGTPGSQIARIADLLDRSLRRLNPAAVLTFGDTSTTAGAALAAAYNNIPIAHIEAGLRSFDRSSPEEKNRLLADHLATWRFCPTMTAVRNLRREGITEGVHGVGDILYESFRRERLGRGRSRALAAYGLKPKAYYLITCHRAENVDDPDRLRCLVSVLLNLGYPVVFPIHPRARKNLKRQRLLAGLMRRKQLILTPPLGYHQTLSLLAGAQAVLTDSGGLQREACWLQTPCLTLRDRTEWVETVQCGANRVVDLDPERVMRALNRPWNIKALRDPCFQLKDPARRIVMRLGRDLA